MAEPLRCDFSTTTDGDLLAWLRYCAEQALDGGHRAVVEESAHHLFAAVLDAQEPTPARCLWGAHIHSGYGPDATALFGQLPQMVKAFSAKKLEPDPRSYGLVAWAIDHGVSVGFNQRLRDTVSGGLAAIAAGQHDARLIAWAGRVHELADALAAKGAHLDVSIEAEMDQGTPSSGADQDTRYKRGFTPREFKGAHNRIAEMLSEHAPTTTLTPVWAGWNLAGTGGRRITDWCPDLDYPVVKMLGVDIYPLSAADQRRGWDDDPNARAFLDFAGQRGMQVCIPETGVHDAGPVTRDWFAHTAEWADRVDLHHLLYFHGTGVLGDTRLVSPEAFEGLRGVLGRRA